MALALFVGCADEQPSHHAAKPAADFGASLGMNTKSAYQGTPHDNDTKVIEALKYMGILNIRDGVWPPWETQQRAFFQAAGQQGIRFNLGFGCLEDINTVAEKLNDFRARNLMQYVRFFEGPNEVNYPHSSCSTADWANRTRAYVQQLWDLTAPERATGTKIIAPSLAGPSTHQDYQQLGDITPWIDIGNFHPYSGPGHPETAVDREAPPARTSFGDKPMSATEFGWYTPDWAPTERVQGIYTMRAFLDFFDKGLPVNFIHEIVDFGSTFGLYRGDWTPKPAAHYMHNLTTLTQANGPRVTDPGGLRFGWRNVPDDVRYVLLRAPNFYVAVLWKAVPHDGASSTITLTTDQRPALVRRFDPTIGTGYRQQWTSPASINVSVGPSPTVLRIWP